MMDENYIKSLITKFWDGTASMQECVALLNFLESNESNNGFFDSTVEQSYNLSNLLEPVRKEEILEKIELEISKKIKRDKSISHSILFRRLSMYAAIIAVMFTTFITIEILKNEKSNINKTVVATIKTDTISNKSEDVKSITLPDKSTILLYPNSSICFEHTFKSRNISLIGKAFFKVFHDEKSIFSVTTGNILTTDIGTEFEIDALKKEKIAIHLLSGKIKVGKALGSKMDIQDQYLNTGELLILDMISGKVVLEKPTLSEPLKKDYNKQLVFNKTPLYIVFEEIALKYNTKIKFKKEELTKLTFTGRVEPKDSLNNILNIICNVNYLSFSSDSSGFSIVNN